MELDRRLLMQRVQRLEKQIGKMEQRKELARQRRSKNGITTVALVGYTNAGKSSLFNILAGQEAISDDRLFVTLDSTARRVHIAEDNYYVLSDTVGFIRDLPHELIAGFRATLADTAECDLLLIVIDVSRNDWHKHLALVENLLEDIGTTSHRIIVFNKIDVIEEVAKVITSECGKITSVYLSCHTNEGIPLLRQLISDIASNKQEL